MKSIILLLTCLFAMNIQAGAVSPLQREAVRYVIQDSQGAFGGEYFKDFLMESKVLTKTELRYFPEVIVHEGFKYVKVTIDDCVYDVVIVVVGPDGKAISGLYIDYSERRN
jgi:hypothetical protein